MASGVREAVNLCYPRPNCESTYKKAETQKLLFVCVRHLLFVTLT
jgi:hypothetical protein